VPRPAARRGSTVAAHAEAGRRAPGPARGARNRGPPHALRGDPRSSPPTNRRSRSSAPRSSRRATRSTGRPSANPASGPTPDRRLVPVGLGSPVALLAQPPDLARMGVNGRENRTGCRRTGASAQPGPEAWACRRTPRPTPAHPAAEPFERRCLPADLDRPASRDRCHHRPEPEPSLPTAIAASVIHVSATSTIGSRRRTWSDTRRPRASRPPRPRRTGWRRSPSQTARRRSAEIGPEGMRAHWLRMQLQRGAQVAQG
jgi:hypothetical protein